MRLGILLGFLIGAAIASLLASQEAAEPATETAATGDGLLKKLKSHAEQARAAAREASEEKQAEMLRDWEQTRHQDVQS